MKISNVIKNKSRGAGSVLRSQAGFTLVELMVVVAIIGILATLAIPRFNSFMARSRQSEVKLALAAARTAVESFRAENGLSGCIQQAGFQPSAGQTRYAIGFNGAVLTANFCGPAGNTRCDGFAGWPQGGGAGPATEVCVAANVQWAANSFVAPATAPQPVASLLNGPSTALGAEGRITSATQYVIGGVGNVGGRNGGANLPDIWTINEVGALVNSQPGI